MIAYRRQVLQVTRYLLLFLLSTLEIGCLSLNGSSSQGDLSNVSVPTSEPKPEFVRRVSPAESVRIPLNVYQSEVPNNIGFSDSLGAYNSNICVEIGLVGLLQSGDRFTEIEVVVDRMDMFVDGQRLMEIHSMFGASEYVYEWADGYTKAWSSPLTFCWRDPLDAGLHEVRFQFRQTSGDIQSYTWYFLLTEEQE